MLTVIRRIVCAAVALVVCVIISGCGGEKMTAMEKVQKMLTEYECSKTDATIQRFSNKGENTYETTQYSKITGEYRMEIKSPEAMNGNYTVFDGTSVKQYNAKTDETVSLDVPKMQKGSQLFISTFIKNYLMSENVSVETAASLDESVCTVLEAVIPEGNKYISTEKLWVDNKTLLPLKLVIYDENGGERYIITYNNFEYNPEIDSSVFSAK